MGVEDDLLPPESTPEELRVGALVANLAKDPTDDARARIMSAVRNAPSPATASRRRLALGSRFRLALVGFGAAGLMLSASAGALAASSNALPSSPAYGLRRLQENVRVAVAAPRQQPRLRLQFAAEKLRQAKVLAAKGDVIDAARLLSDSKQDLADAQAELHDLHDPSTTIGLSAEEAQLQTEVVSEQIQVETIASGGTVNPAPSDSIPAPGDGSTVPAPESQAPPPNNPAASPESNPASSTDTTPTP